MLVYLDRQDDGRQKVLK